MGATLPRLLFIKDTRLASFAQVLKNVLRDEGKLLIVLFYTHAPTERHTGELIRLNLQSKRRLLLHLIALLSVFFYEQSPCNCSLSVMLVIISPGILWGLEYRGN